MTAKTVSKTDSKFNVKLIAITAMCAALITVTTAFIKIPSPLGYSHAGDSMIYLAARILPGPFGIIASSIGGALADLISGYPHWAIPTAIIKAAIAVSKKTGKMVTPEIMVPLVLEVKELKFVKNIITTTADKLIAESGLDMKYHVGTMIEIPRAALLSDEIAKEAEFFSFGTNDLTQMTFGFSRDDAGKFLPSYYEAKILEEDPFKTLDQRGVGKLVEMSVKLGRSTRPELHVGVCGETGGDPKSVEFYHNVGLDYVSCSPFRVPVARLAAAQAAIKSEK